jgi:beta-glucosidase
MSAYNSVNGIPATQNRWLLTERLKRDWRFTGFVISDAAATGGATVLHMTEPDTPTAATHAWQAGLDVVFQSTVDQHRPYWDAVQRRMVSATIIDSAVARVLRVKFQLGLFERPYTEASPPEPSVNPESRRALARQAAAAAIVLLRNERQTLPLSPRMARIAVIGSDAAVARLGGYTAPNAGGVSILEAVRERVDRATTVRYASGPGRLRGGPVAVPATHLASDSGGAAVRGLRAEYFDNTALAGEPRLRRRDATVDFAWTLGGPARVLPRDWYSVRWTGRVIVPDGDSVRLGVEGNDGYRLWLDGQLFIDNWRKRSHGSRFGPGRLVPGRTYDFRLEYFETAVPGRVRLVWDRSGAEEAAPRIAEAAAAASESDVAIVAAGIEEGEFRDRSLLRLPGYQEELIDALARTGTPVVVVLIGGSAITMSRWLDRVRAVVHAWYPGEEGGRAITDVLFGAVNPAGRLPITFPLAEGQLPLVYNHKPTGRGDDYLDLTGQPLFPFGYGLSYSAFEYSGLTIEPARISPHDSAVVRFRVKNMGPLAGDEVVQLYIRDVLASVAQPVIALKGFRRLSLAAGEEREVSFVLSPNELSLIRPDGRRVVEPGEFRVLAGASSRDLRLRGTLTVQ